jgi:hypothetical protein
MQLKLAVGLGISDHKLKEPFFKSNLPAEKESEGRTGQSRH